MVIDLEKWRKRMSPQSRISSETGSSNADAIAAQKELLAMLVGVKGEVLKGWVPNAKDPVQGLWDSLTNAAAASVSVTQGFLMSDGSPVKMTEDEVPFTLQRKNAIVEVKDKITSGINIDFIPFTSIVTPGVREYLKIISTRGEEETPLATALYVKRDGIWTSLESFRPSAFTRLWALARTTGEFFNATIGNGVRKGNISQDRFYLRELPKGKEPVKPPTVSAPIYLRRVA